MNDYDAESVEAHEYGAWEGAAAIYEEHVATLTANSGQIDIINDLIDLDGTDRVLDIGCGPGILTAQVAAFANQAIGIDFSAKMIDEARKLHPGLTFEVENAEKLPFPDRSFNAAVVNYCAHHLARPEKAMKEIRRVLSANGRIAIIHPIQSRQPSWGSFASAVEEVLPPETVPGGFLLNVDQPQVFIDLLINSGFRDVECREREKPVTLEKLKTLLDSGWTIAGLHSQPTEVQSRIEVGVRQRAQAFQNSDGSYTFPDVVLAASARV
jgi:SAM-dependent methyltransferase